MKKILLGAEVWEPGRWGPEGAEAEHCLGKVIRQTNKSIWIQRWNSIEKWNIQSDGYWKCPSQYGTMTKDFEFLLDPLVAFIHSKEAAK